ncbi:O-succinylbenzoate synthase [Egibacter rhizosphaerae]|uniref:o-succinylbenzoate synthase n=1 Tax=Egibacter rhizosphaerae TaxID=1670831 RepID=A0A411YGI4_9ACTN|nr:o-succinylbenzoate synthase [Egibacter rhizosphaerae]QBI20350.1 O-succinylbenzoate synthase [Egibacter rhizosphaerae]
MHPFVIPLTTRFRGVDERAGVLVEGAAGWGEFSPFPEYPPEVAARWAAAAREAANAGWPAPRRERVPVNCLVPAVGPDRAAEIVAASGCATAKVKVAEPSQPLSADIDRVAAVRAALGPGGHVRVDANAAWDLEAAERALRALDRYALEYAEQPVPGLDGLAELRRRVDVPLAADEAIRTADDPLRAANTAACDVVVVKVQPLGGVAPALEIAHRCHERGVATVVSSAVETSVGLAAGVALAAALPELPHACGLGTQSLLTGDVVVDPLVPVAGSLPVGPPTVDPEALARWTPDPDRAAALRERLRAAEAVVAGGDPR